MTKLVGGHLTKQWFYLRSIVLLIWRRKQYIPAYGHGQEFRQSSIDDINDVGTR